MDNPHEGTPPDAEPDEPTPPARRGPGRPPRKFGKTQRAELLDLIRAGFGVEMAMTKVGISRRLLYRVFNAEPGFRDQFESARKFDAEYLFFLRRKLALGDEEAGVPPDPAGLEFLIRQHAAKERFGWEVRESARARRDAKEAARLAAMGPAIGHGTIKVEYEDPDDRLHRPADAEAPPSPPGAAEDP